MDDLKIKAPHVDPDHLLALAIAVVLVVFPDVADAAGSDAVAAVLTGIGGRYGVRIACAISAGRRAAAQIEKGGE